MTKQIAFIMIIVLRIFFNPSHDQKDTLPFASPMPLSASTIPGNATNVTRTHSSERLINKWVIGDNRPGLCYNSCNVPGFRNENAANPFSFASNERSILFQKNKS